MLRQHWVFRGDCLETGYWGCFSRGETVLMTWFEHKYCFSSTLFTHMVQESESVTIILHAHVVLNTHELDLIPNPEYLLSKRPISLLYIRIELTHDCDLFHWSRGWLIKAVLIHEPHSKIGSFYIRNKYITITSELTCITNMLRFRSYSCRNKENCVMLQFHL